MGKRLEETARQLAGNGYKYCPIARCCVMKFRHVFDHIIARQSTEAAKSPSPTSPFAAAIVIGIKGHYAGLDEDTGALVPLFNPRRDVWRDHFRWDGAVLMGITPVGRTTVPCSRSISRFALPPAKLSLRKARSDSLIKMRKDCFPPIPHPNLVHVSRVNHHFLTRSLDVCILLARQ